MLHFASELVFESPVAQPEKDRNWTGPVGRLQPGTGCGCLHLKVWTGPLKTGCNRSLGNRLPRHVELNFPIILVYYTSQTDKNSGRYDYYKETHFRMYQKAYILTKW